MPTQKGIASSLIMALGKTGADAAKNTAASAKNNAANFAKSLVVDNPLSQFVRGIGSVGGGFMGNVRDAYKGYRGTGGEEEDAPTTRMAPERERIPSRDEDQSLHLQAIHETLVEMVGFLKKNEKGREAAEGAKNAEYSLVSGSMLDAVSAVRESSKSTEETMDRYSLVSESMMDSVARMYESAQTEDAESMREYTRVATETRDILSSQRDQNSEIIRISTAQQALLHREDVRRRREMEWAEKDEVRKLRARRETDAEDAVPDGRAPESGGLGPDEYDEDGKRKKRRGGGFFFLPGGFGGLFGKLGGFLKNLLNPKFLLRGGLIGAIAAALLIGIKEAIGMGGFDGLMDALKSVKEGFMKFWNSLEPIFDAFIGLAGALFGPVFTAFGETMSKLGTTLGHTLGGLGDAMGALWERISPVVPIIANSLADLGKILGWLVTVAFKPIEVGLVAIGKIFEGLGVLISDPGQFIGWLVDGFKALPGYLADTWMDMIKSFPFADEIKNFFVDTFADIKEAVGGIVDAVKNWFAGWFGREDEPALYGDFNREKDRIEREETERIKREHGRRSDEYRNFKQAVRDTGDDVSFHKEYIAAHEEAMSRGEKLSVEEYIMKKFGIGPSGPEPRRLGGEVRRDKMYVVGEDGPELFAPKQDGEIIPHADAREVDRPASLVSDRMSRRESTRETDAKREMYSRIMAESRQRTMVLHDMRRYEEQAYTRIDDERKPDGAAIQAYTRIDDERKPDDAAMAVHEWMERETPEITFENPMVSVVSPEMRDAADEMMESESFHEAVQMISNLAQPPSVKSSVVNAPSTNVVNNQRTDNSVTNYAGKKERALSTWGT